MLHLRRIFIYALPCAQHARTSSSSRQQQHHPNLHHIKWIGSNFGVVCSVHLKPLVTMPLPLKKRPMRGPMPLAKRVKRVERAVGRQKPDLITTQLTTTVGSGGVTGYNEVWLSPMTNLAAAFTADFIVEWIKVRADVISNGNSRNNIRIDVVVPVDDQVQPTTTRASGVLDHFDPKIYKTYASYNLTLNDANPQQLLDFSTKLGLVVKQTASTIRRNNVFLCVRYYLTGSTQLGLDLAFQMGGREK